MVLVKKISFSGFKSFPDRTPIKLSKGFSVITGPNGAGKSNIIDALLFVLGSISSKSMRANKLSELLFQPPRSSSRKEASSALVDLYLANFGDGQELKVSRRVNRQGQSHYKLDGRTVPRHRVLNTLAQAEIKPDGHNIIMQGDVTKLIEMSPKERREIIDEIAGIAEFERKQEKSEKELVQVERRLAEAQIRLRERRKRIRELDREANEAQQYRKLQERLQIIKASFYKAKAKEATKRIESLKHRKAKKKRELKEVEKGIEKLEKLAQSKESELHGAELKLEKLADPELQRKISLKERKMERIKSKLLESKHRKKQLRVELRDLRKAAKEQEDLTGTKATKACLKLEGVYGTIEQLLDVEPENRALVEAAAGSHLNDLVVDSRSTAEKCIEHLKKKKAGRATFLPLDSLSFRRKDLSNLLKKPEVKGLALNYINYGKKFEPAFSYVFGKTLVVDSIKPKINERLVTLDGDLVQRSGAIIGGWWKGKPKLKSLSQETKKKKKELAALKKKIPKLKEKLTELTAKLSELKAQKNAKIYWESKKLRRQLRKKLDQLRLEREQMLEQKIQLREQIGKIEQRGVEASTSLATNQFKLQRSDVKPLFASKKPEALAQEIKEIKEKIDSLGEINFKAFATLKVRQQAYLDLKKKADRIREEKKSIEELTEEIEAEREQTFHKSFRKVKKNFESIYRELSGGDGELELENNNIQKGLLIKARPKGKSQVSLDAQSRGEKTLTTLAFLFAVQHCKPAPFYILDEVDAMLDAVNSRKVGKLLKKFAKDSQFIVISHNDLIIRAADRVYGVSMGKGISSIMAINPKTK